MHFCLSTKHNVHIFCTHVGQFICVIYLCHHQHVDGIEFLKVFFFIA
jgi:hypothetical protein